MPGYIKNAITHIANCKKISINAK
ncbi:hypothetical protein CHRYSEO8AT_780034 [Chryseobacterium sp. 8AT]|nr:hypothetical protein CHRYSEO8AT_780034 [Chryseobacterium sp. 8AT]